MPIPYFAIHSAKRVPSQSAGNTLHKKQPGKLAFQAAFCARCLCFQRQQGLLVL